MFSTNILFSPAPNFPVTSWYTYPFSLRYFISLSLSALFLASLWPLPFGFSAVSIANFSPLSIFVRLSSVRVVFGLFSIFFVTHSGVFLKSISDSLTCSSVTWLGVGFLFPPSIKDFLASFLLEVIFTSVLVAGSPPPLLASYPALWLSSIAFFFWIKLSNAFLYTAFAPSLPSNPITFGALESLFILFIVRSI